MLVYHDDELITRRLNTIRLPGRQFSDLRTAVIQWLQELVPTLRAQYAGDRISFGISTTGIVRPDGTVASAHFYDSYADVSWRDIIMAEFPGQFDRITILNDGNAATWAEYVARDDPAIQDVLHLSVGTGVGGGMVLAGRLYTGSQGAAGELGHMIVVPGGRKCPCGRYGCAEAYAGLAGVFQSFDDLMDRHAVQVSISAPQDISQLVDAALAGYAPALAAFQEAGKYLGLAIATLTNVLNPRLVTIGGGVAEALATRFSSDEDPLMSAVMQAYSNNVLPRLSATVRICHAKQGNDASWIGAAMFSNAGLDSAVTQARTKASVSSESRRHQYDSN